MYDNRYILPKYCAKEQNVQEVLVFWNVQLYIYLVTTVTNYFADSDYSVLIGYYSWRVTNQIVLWAGHWVRPRSADDRQEKCAASESRMHFWLNLLYRLLDKKKKKNIYQKTKYWPWQSVYPYFQDWSLSVFPFGCTFVFRMWILQIADHFGLIFVVSVI